MILGDTAAVIEADPPLKERELIKLAPLPSAHQEFDGDLQAFEVELP